MTPRLVPVDRVPTHPGAEGEAVEAFRPDALIVVASGLPPRLPAPLVARIEEAMAADASLGQGATLLVAPEAPGGRLILALTGPMDRDHDDVRRVADAAIAGIRRARDAGACRPVIAFRGLPPDARYLHAVEVGTLAALGALWEPLEAREALGEDEVEPVTDVGVVIPDAVDGVALCERVHAIEVGRRLARDLCGTHPERMTPKRFADACQAAFAGTDVEVAIVDDEDVLRADYPLLLAVARASLPVERHRPCVVRLTWEPEGPVHETLLLAGKGVTYDTGGLDLKVGGHMAGMSRDKGGAAAVAGFVRAAAGLRPRGVRLVAELGLVRNSIGAEAFATDEIVVGHAGRRVRIGNTDAEGRLVLADLLSHLREEALSSVAPTVFSVATLTGHAGIAMGPYTVVLENGPARAEGAGADLAQAGELWGDPFEISRLRREDVDMVQPRTKAEDVVSANTEPSSRTPRGHQFPMAFLSIASGLDEHSVPTSEPVPYLHIDIGGSGCEGMDWQHGRPTAAPVSALCARWLLDR